MNMEPIDKYFGISLSEWVQRVPNELDVDAVGLHQIIPVGIDSFGLTGDELERFAKRCIVALVEAGAKPVMPSQELGKYWEHQTQYGSKSEEIASNVIREWNKNPDLATHDGLWFNKFNEVTKNDT